MPSLAQLNAILIKRGINTATAVQKLSRRLRENGDLPSGTGNRSASIDAAGIARTILCCLAGGDAASASRTASRYFDLATDGSATPLGAHLAALLAPTGKAGRFQNLQLDLDHPLAKLTVTYGAGARFTVIEFADRGADSDAERVCRQAILPAETFLGIVQDLQAA